jgi:hypothetical protein
VLSADAFGAFEEAGLEDEERVQVRRHDPKEKIAILPLSADDSEVYLLTRGSDALCPKWFAAPFPRLPFRCFPLYHFQCACSALRFSSCMQKIGRKFRDTVLSLGGGAHPLTVFKEFRGRGPSPEALLRHAGLAPAVA